MGLRPDDAQFRQAYITAQAEFLGSPFKAERRRTVKLEFRKIYCLKIFTAQCALVTDYPPSSHGEKRRSLDMTWAGDCPEGIDPDQVFFQARRKLDVLQVDAGSGQIGTGLGQPQLSSDQRHVPGSVDVQVCIKLSGAFLD